MTDGRSFAEGESEADTAGPSITQESYGAAFKIAQTIPSSRGSHVQQRTDYVMPPIPKQNENVTPAIELSPFGKSAGGGATGVPGPGQDLPAAIPSGTVGYHLHQPAEDAGFESGVRDAWPEGSPVPLR